MVAKRTQAAKPLVSELTEGKHRNLVPFRAGQSGNPKGRPKGARNKLGEEFLAELYNAFVANGRAAIERVIEEDPAAFLRIIASLIPKDIKIDRHFDAGPLSDFTDEELAALVYAARTRLGQRHQPARTRRYVANALKLLPLSVAQRT
jgi:hypothetical protein